MAAWLFITVQDISRLMNLNGIRSRDERYVLQGVVCAAACKNESILLTTPRISYYHMRRPFAIKNT